MHTHSHKNARRAINEGRERRTHTADTLRARRGGRRERSGRHTPNSNLNATARLQNVPGPERVAGDGTAFSMTATVRPRDGGTVAAVHAWNSQSKDWPGGRRAVLFGPTAYRSREGIINGEPGRRHEAVRRN